MTETWSFYIRLFDIDIGTELKLEPLFTPLLLKVNPNWFSLKSAFKYMLHRRKPTMNSAAHR